MVLKDKFHDLPEKKNVIMMLHKSFGVTAFILAILFVMARWVYGRPPLVLTRWWEGMLAKLVHYALWVLMIAVPLTGLLLTQFSVKPLIFFNVFEVPKIVTPDQHWVKFFYATHKTFTPILFMAILVHVLGAWTHWVRGEKQYLNLISKNY